MTMVLLANCKNQSTQDPFLNMTFNIVNYSEMDTKEVISPWDIQILDTLILVQDDKDPDGVIKVYDSNSGLYINCFGVRGRGPFELNNPHSLNVDKINDKIWIASTPPWKMYGFSFNSIVNGLEWNESNITKVAFPENELVINYAFISDSNYVVSLNKDDAHIVLFNKSGKKVGQYGNRIEGKTNLNDFQEEEYFLRQMVLDTDSMFLFSSYLIHDIITRTSLVDGQIKVFKMPGYEIENPKVNSNLQVLNRVSYRTLRYRDGFVYVSYLGENGWDESNNCEIFPKAILVFDTALNPIKRYNLQFGIRSFDISSDGKLYVSSDSFVDKILIYNINSL